MQEVSRAPSLSLSDPEKLLSITSCDSRPPIAPAFEPSNRLASSNRIPLKKVSGSLSNIATPAKKRAAGAENISPNSNFIEPLVKKKKFTSCLNEKFLDIVIDSVMGSWSRIHIIG